MTHSKAAYIQPLLTGQRDNKEAWKAWVIGAQPHHGAKFIQGQLQKCKTKYGKWKCTNCPKFVRSYCSCTPGLMFCADCFGDHRAAVAIGGAADTNFGIPSL